MIQQQILDLTPPFGLLSGLAPTSETADRVEYRHFATPRGLKRRSVPDFAHLDSVETWSLEPYRGLEFEALTEASRWHARKRRILVNDRLPEVLGRALPRHRHERLSITIGDPFEAYPSEERRFGITRSVLRALEASRGYQIDLTTRSPLILRDQDSLQKLDLNHAVTVFVPIATLDPVLQGRLEPETATPASRLEIVRSLASEGISVVVSCGPMLPGINNSADELNPLFDAIRRAGALDVIGDTRLSAPKHRRRVAAWLEQHFPTRAERVLGRLAGGRNGALLGTLDRLRLSYGFPVPRAGRG